MRSFRILIYILIIAAALVAVAISFEPVKTVPIEIKTPVYVIHEYSIKGMINFEIAEDFKHYILDKKSTDIILLHIESAGGYVTSYNKIQFYLRRTNATVHCYVDSHAASAAAMILTSCPTMFATPDSFILFHITHMPDNTGKTVPINETDYPKKWLKNIKEFEKIRYLFTEKEYGAIFKGEDVILSGKELMERYENRNALEK
jgi:ATP-dependent protease ClpP protease subunit